MSYGEAGHHVRCTVSKYSVGTVEFQLVIAIWLFYSRT
jgi:hypothetical protein